MFVLNTLDISKKKYFDENIENKKNLFLDFEHLKI